VVPFLTFSTVITNGLAPGSLKYGDVYYGDYTGDCIADFVISQNGNSLYFFEGDQAGNLHYT